MVQHLNIFTKKFVLLNKNTYLCRKLKHNMKKNRITITEDMLKLISAIKFRDIEIPSNFNDGKYILGVEDVSFYGGSSLYEDVAFILGIYDKRIEGSENEYDGARFSEDIEKYITETHNYILKHLLEIETLVHYYSNKGGITPGVYNTITLIKEN